MISADLMRGWVTFVVRHRVWVLVAALLVTAGLTARITHLRIEIDPNRFLPQSHPYVVTSDRVEDLFGSRYVLAIGITPVDGNIYDPLVLGKVERITDRLREVPGVVKNNILSFAARKAKSIAGTEEGMEVLPLMDAVPQTVAELADLRQRVTSNPAFHQLIVSRDHDAVAVLAEFQDDPSGFRSIMERVAPVIDAERDSTVRIATGGIPVMLAQFEINSERMGLLLPVAMALIAIVLWFAFRGVQGLALPLLTAILAVLWSLGIMSLFGVPLDVFNATTPVLILAVASGHAVQILKRYYEEFRNQAALLPEDPREASRRAVIDSLTRVGPVMLVAGCVAALSFLSLVVFEISSVRTFGIFAACGILSSLVLELSLIPSVRAMMRPPRSVGSAASPGPLERAMARLASAASGAGAARIALGGLLVIGVALLGAAQLRYEESLKSFFSRDLPIMQDDDRLNETFAGTNALYVLVQSETPGRMQDPDVLAAIDGMQQLMQRDPNVGRSVSIADFVRRMNMAMHGDDPRHDVIPTEPGLAAQYLFLYSNSGDPGDFDTYVDYDYQHANIWAFLKEHHTAKLRTLVDSLQAYATRSFPHDVKVSFGGSVAQGTAIHEIISRAKLLNMLQIGAVIFVLTAVVFRSLLAGVLVLVPLGTTVAANFGLMGWTGIPFNVPNSITAAMAVGIGADYAIYLLFRLREEYARHGNLPDAMRATLVTAGSAIVFVAVAVGAGYSVLMLSHGFWAHIWMGILISSAMLVSAVAAITLVPVLVRWIRPAFLLGATRPPLSRGAPAALLLALMAGALTPERARAAAAETVTAEDVMQRAFMVDRVAGSRTTATTKLRNKHGQERVRVSTTTTRLDGNGIDNQRIVVFSAPADVKGTGILLLEQSTAEDDIWIYLPALKKVRRLVASNKRDSFAGTDFSYGDVIGHAVDDWRHALRGEDTVNGEPCHLVESVPASASVRETSGYSRRMTCVSKVRGTMLRAEVWDAEGAKLKEMAFDDFRNVDPAQGKWVAMKATARNVQTGHQTEVLFSDYRVDARVPAGIFTTRSLEFGH